MVETIAAQLSKADPKFAETYQQNAALIKADLQKLDSWIKAQIATIPNDRRKLVTTHDALGYYAQAYGIPLQSALLGISTNEQATPDRIADLVKDIRSAGVPTIFAELTANPKLIEAVAKEAQVKIAPKPLLTDGLGQQGQDGDTYQKMLIHNTQTIVEGLGGNFTPFQP
jgi:manganese/iron transport system substrate-binding protein